MRVYLLGLDMSEVFKCAGGLLSDGLSGQVLSIRNSITVLVINGRLAFALELWVLL